MNISDFFKLFVIQFAGFQQRQVFILVKDVQFNMEKLYISAFWYGGDLENEFPKSNIFVTKKWKNIFEKGEWYKIYFYLLKECCCFLGKINIDFTSSNEVNLFGN